MRSGFPILEFLVSMAIFLFGITALLGMFQVGGGFEQEARVHAELTPVLEPLVQQLQREAWELDESRSPTRLRVYRGETVPGAPDYRFDLELLPEGLDPGLRRAELRFYKRSPERVLARLPIVLVQTVPIERRVASTP